MTLVPMTMSGFDRTYMPPRGVRKAVTAVLAGGDDALLSRTVSGGLTAWDLFELEHREETAEWATATLASVVATAEDGVGDVLGCNECPDTGFYGIVDDTDPDLLVGLVRRSGTDAYESLAADGAWSAHESDRPVEVLDLDLAGDLAAAITAGASGLLLRYCSPRMFLPPESVLAATALRDVLSADEDLNPQPDWANYAVVDEQDPGAVLDLVRVHQGEVDQMERWDGEAWTPDAARLVHADLPLAPLSESLTASIQALVADAPLTVSPDPRAEKLRRYWSTGKGALKIRWQTPGDWKRCYRHLSKYMGLRAKGYCQNLHKRNDGVWTGDRRNPGGNGHRGRSLLRSLESPESSLLASIQNGQWAKERTATMAPEIGLPDGVYCEADEQVDGLLQTLIAAGFPVAPKDEWYADPKLTKPTPITVEDDGRVYGHIAPWGVTHIGMAGKVPPPHSAANYAYFTTGALKTASGKQVNVGQITLVGGHASRYASAEQAVKHYDDTDSAVVDVTAGEDRYGIWVAGSVRPSVTPEQIRAFRASAVSGDWRDVNGHLELVAVCAVNVPGFMNPRAEARVASGAILSLVAAGAREMAELRAGIQADATLSDRIQAIEAQLAAPIVEPVAEPEEAVVAAPAVAEAPEAEAVVVEATEPEVEDPRTAIRQTVSDIQRELLRRKVRDVEAACKPKKKKDMTAAGKVPPQFVQKAKKDAPASSEGSSAITDVASLKSAIAAFGDSKNPAADKKMITAMCFKLKRPDLIPDNWKAKSNA